jgi:maleate isomerase
MLAKYRIGMITPSVNTALEPLTTRFTRDLDEDLSVHFTRIAVSEVGLDDQSAKQFTFDTFAAAARLLVDAQAQVIAWNGTSGSWMGAEAERDLCRRLEDMFGVRFVTSTLALLQAFSDFGVHRFSLAVPYASDMADRIAANYGLEGFECVRKVSRGWNTAGEVGANADDLGRLLADAADETADGIAVVCTNIAAAPLVERFEQDHGITVFDSVAVTARTCLIETGMADPSIANWGRVLFNRPQVPAS